MPRLDRRARRARARSRARRRTRSKPAGLPRSHPRCAFTALDAARPTSPPLKPQHESGSGRMLAHRGRRRAGMSAAPAAVSADDLLVEAAGLMKYFPVRRGVAQRVAATSRRSTASTSHPPGRDGRARRRVRLREVDARPHAAPPLRADRGPDPFRRARTSRALGARTLRRMRREMQMVFQDPYASLDPRQTRRRHRRRGARDPRHRAAPRAAARVAELLERVGLEPPAQRALPARVLRRPAAAHRHRPGARASSRSFIVCDEPVSALDVSIQAQILNLLDASCSRTSA